jgi:hypothetical protein
VRRIKRSLGILAATVLALAGVGAGPASAATHSIAGSKAAWQAAIANVRTPGTGCYHASYPALRWHAVKCVTGPDWPAAPTLPPAAHAGPMAVGNGTDYSAQVTGLISKATGTFQNVSQGITETGKVDNKGDAVANAFMLQINSQTFTGSAACKGASCMAWQQFLYGYRNDKTAIVFMQYWLISYDGTCPDGWHEQKGTSNCYKNSPEAKVTPLTAAQLASTQLSGSAATDGDDVVSLTVGSGQATSVTEKDSVLGLAKSWNTTEWGVFGDFNSAEAVFGANTTLETVTTLTATSTTAPTCLSKGYTGETNNLTLTATPALGTVSSPTMGSEQTNGTVGTASCATGAKPS